jgi:hypothetical protein
LENGHVTVEMGSVCSDFKPAGGYHLAKPPGSLSLDALESAPARDRLRMSRRNLGRLGEHEKRLAVVGNGRFVNDNA